MAARFGRRCRICTDDAGKYRDCLKAFAFAPRRITTLPHMLAAPKMPPADDADKFAIGHASARHSPPRSVYRRLPRPEIWQIALQMINASARPAMPDARPAAPMAAAGDDAPHVSAPAGPAGRATRYGAAPPLCRPGRRRRHDTAAAGRRVMLLAEAFH